MNRMLDGGLDAMATVARRRRFPARAPAWAAARPLAVFVFLLVLGLATAASTAERRPAQPAGPWVRAELIGASAGIEPGGHVWVGLHQRIAPGWHTYWINP